MNYQIDGEIFNISSVQIRVLEPAPAIIPFQDSSMGPFHSFGLSVITLEDEDGYLGEAPVYSSYVNILERFFFPILFFNHDIPYAKLYHKLYWSIRNEGFRGQASALLGQLDMALYDLAARRKGLPLYKYLNADRNYVRLYSSGGGTNYSYRELEEEVSMFLDQGTDCIKMKVGMEFGTRMEEDIKRVRFVRKLIGGDIKLAVDANQIWNCEQALNFIQHVEDQDIAWLEEPVHSASLSDIEKLCKSASIKISYGESERSSKIFPALVNAGVRHLQPIPNHLGSIKEWMEVRDLATRASVDFSFGGYTMYTSSFMTTASADWQVEYLQTIMRGLEEYFAVYPKRVKDKLVLPDIVGMPVRIDWDYCIKKDKIITSQSWSKDNVREYSPAVSI